MKDKINGHDFKLMFSNAAALITINKQGLNELNVFPVPDGDTGTNMSLTINSTASALSGTDEARISRVAEAAASALLRGGRGNSGVILSLLFRGVSRILKDCDEADAPLFAAALAEGAQMAYRAVMNPTEGTVLTVSRLSAAAAKDAAESGDFETMLLAAYNKSLEALEDTKKQNPVLEKAGVVDAGAKGWCFILEGMLAGVRGEEIKGSDEAGAEAEARGSVFSTFATEDIKFTYCTEYIVSRDDRRRDPLLLRAFLESIGDCVVVVDDEDIIKVHVHTNNPGLVLEEGGKYGLMSKLKIENMREQHTNQTAAEQHTEEPAPAPAPIMPKPASKHYGFVAVASGEGICEVFRDLGADSLVEGGQTMNPSTEDIFEAVSQTPAEVVFVLPNNKNIIMAAEQAVGLSTDKRIIVVPTKTIPQGVSAMLAFDPSATDEENLEAMKEAAARVRTGAITYAARDSVFDGVEIKQGDYLSLLEGKVIKTGSDFGDTATALTEGLKLEEASFVTVFTGEGATAEHSASLTEKIREKLPSSGDLSLIEGGQPVYYYIISVE